TRGAQERFKDLAPSSFGLISMAARRPSPRGGRQARTWRGPVSPEKTREGVEPPGPPSWPNPFYPGEGSRGLRPPHGQHRDARQAVARRRGGAHRSQRSAGSQRRGPQGVGLRQERRGGGRAAQGEERGDQGLRP